jgi:hypothetical protein
MKKGLLVTVLFIALLSACAPAATLAPTAMPVESLSPAVVTMDMFYTFINAAQTVEDFILPWNMLTLDEQCNPRDKCDIQYFYERWSKSMAYYRLYDCGSNTVTAEEMLYPRDTHPSALPENSKYWTYELVDYDGVLMIGDTYLMQKPGDGCVLAIERVPQP